MVELDLQRRVRGGGTDRKEGLQETGVLAKGFLFPLPAFNSQHWNINWVPAEYI